MYRGKQIVRNGFHVTKMPNQWDASSATATKRKRTLTHTHTPTSNTESSLICYSRFSCECCKCSQSVELHDCCSTIFVACENAIIWSRKEFRTLRLKTIRKKYRSWVENIANKIPNSFYNRKLLNVDCKIAAIEASTEHANEKRGEFTNLLCCYDY